MALATRPDVEARLGRTLETTQEMLLVEHLLGDVEGMLLGRLPSLLTRAEADLSLRARIVGTEAQAVVRVLRNPEGYRSEQTGPFGYSIDTRAAAGFLMVLADEWALLGAKTAFTITPFVETPVLGSPWVGWS